MIYLAPELKWRRVGCCQCLDTDVEDGKKHFILIAEITS